MLLSSDVESQEMCRDGQSRMEPLLQTVYHGTCIEISGQASVSFSLEWPVLKQKSSC